MSTKEQVERSLCILKVCGRDNESLHISLRKLQKKIVFSGREPLHSIEKSANLEEADFEWRAVLIGGTKAEVASNIQRNIFLKGSGNLKPRGSLCFLFSGFGTIYSDMEKPLYTTSTVFRVHFDYCRKAFKSCRNVDGVLDIFSMQYALLKMWESWGVKPDYVLGQSMGEYSAAVCAGVLSVDQAITVLIELDQQMFLLPSGRTIAIRASEAEVFSLMETHGLSSSLDVALVNSDSQTIIGGDVAATEALCRLCAEKGIKCTKLTLSHAAHSRHADPVVVGMRKVTKKLKVYNQIVESERPAYISAMRGGLLLPEDFDGEYWARLPRDKVLFKDACKAALELGCSTFVEIGQHPILSPLVMTNADENVLCLPSLHRGEDHWGTLLHSLGKLYLEGVPVNWAAFHEP